MNRMTTRCKGALAIGFAALNANCGYGIYSNSNIRDVFSKFDGQCRGMIEDARGKTSACERERAQELGQLTSCLGKRLGDIRFSTALIREEALLRNPLARTEDQEAVGKAVGDILGQAPRSAPRTAETALILYDWVSEKVGVDRESDSLASPLQVLETRFANVPSRLILLSAMLETAFPYSTRLTKTHTKSKSEISLQFNVLMLSGARADAAKEEEALAAIVALRYGIPGPEARKTLKGALTADGNGVWLTLNPERGREGGLSGKQAGWQISGGIGRNPA